MRIAGRGAQGDQQVIAHRCSIAGVVILAACGGSTTNGAVEQIAPASGYEPVINCLVKVTTDAGYRVMRKDPGNGFLEAERRQQDFKEDSPRQYAQGDKLVVERSKKGAKGQQALLVTMYSFRMDWQANGGNQTLLAPSATGKADLEKFVAACGPNGIAIPAPAAAPGT
jgi:hypothetical protein